MEPIKSPTLLFQQTNKDHSKVKSAAPLGSSPERLPLEFSSPNKQF